MSAAFRSSSTTPSPRPYLCRPFEHGADIVVHSATKFIGGHGTSIGGVIVDRRQVRLGRTASSRTDGARSRLSRRALRRDARDRWPTSSRPACSCCATSERRSAPFNAFLFLQGLETLHLRMERHSENALAGRPVPGGAPAVEWVNYPGLEDHPSYELAQKYLPKGAGRDLHLRHQGRAGGRRAA